MVSLRLLLVEDSEHDAKLLLRHLSEGDFDIYHQCVDNAVDMQDALRATNWDLIIADYTMPCFNGGSPIASLTRFRGLSELIGSWKIIWTLVT